MVVTVYRDAEDSDHVEVYMGRQHPIQIVEGTELRPDMLFTVGAWKSIFGERRLPVVDRPATVDMELKGKIVRVVYEEQDDEEDLFD